MRYSPEAIADLLERTREHIGNGRWAQSAWAWAKVKNELGQQFWTAEIPPAEARGLNDIEESCGWRFCLGGALVWETLPQKTPAGRARAFVSIDQVDTLAKGIAAAAVRELVIGTLKDPAAVDEDVFGLVNMLVDWNDRSGRTATDVRRLLATTARRLRKQAAKVQAS